MAAVSDVSLYKMERWWLKSKEREHEGETKKERMSSLYICVSYK